MTFAAHMLPIGVSIRIVEAWRLDVVNDDSSWVKEMMEDVDTLFDNLSNFQIRHPDKAERVIPLDNFNSILLSVFDEYGISEDGYVVLHNDIALYTYHIRKEFTDIASLRNL